jgi:thioredoxin 1
MTSASELEAIDDLNFDTEVLGSELSYLLDIGAVWCAPCKVLQPIVEEFAREHRGQLRVGKLDIDDSPAVAARLGVRGAPTLVLFRNGQEVGRKLGVTSARGLLELTGLSTRSHDFAAQTRP